MHTRSVRRQHRRNTRTSVAGVLNSPVRFACVAALVVLAATLPVPVATAASAETPAQPAATLSLTDALKGAIRGNPDLRRERVAMDSAAATLMAAYGAFDVTLTGGLTAARRVLPRLTDADIGGGFTESLTLDLGVARALETGGRLALTVQGVGSRTSSRFQCGGLPAAMGMACDVYTSQVALSFTQPLLRGFGSEVATANIRRQTIQRDIALQNRLARASVVVRDVVSAYWELAYASRDLAIRQSAVALAQEQRRVSEVMVEVGRLGKLEMAAVDRAIADRMQDVATAQQLMLVRALDLQRLLGRPVAADFAPPAASDEPSPAALAIDPRAETTRALESSPQLRALRSGIALSELDVRTTEALLRPRLDFVGSVGAAGRRPDLAAALEQVAGFEAPVWSAGLTFEWPVQNRAARGNGLAARAAGDRARIDVEDLELAIRDSVVRFSSAARTAARRLELARAAVEHAQKSLEAERARFEVGRATNNDVLLRQQELKTAEVQVARASVDQALAEAALSAVGGDILDRYRIVLEGS